MSLIVPPFGSVDVIVPASGIVTAFSQGAFTINQQITNTNVPGMFSVLTSQAAGAAAPYTSSAFTNGAVVRIEASGGKEVSYDVGLAPAAKLGRATTHQGSVVTAITIASTLTVPQICGGIITSTSGGTIALTLPIGSVMESSGSWQIGEGVIWSVIVLGAGGGTVTAGASGHTVVGAGAVATGTSGHFLTLKTAASTYVSYRVG